MGNMLLTMQDSDDFIYRGTIAQLAYITKLICIISKFETVLRKKEHIHYCNSLSITSLTLTDTRTLLMDFATLGLIKGCAL